MTALRVPASPEATRGRAARELGRLRRGGTSECFDQHLLDVVADERKVLHEEIDRRHWRARGQHFERFFADARIGVLHETLPARDAAFVRLLRGESREKRDAIVDRTARGELPEQRLERAARRHLNDHAPREVLHLERFFRLFRRGEELRELGLDSGQSEAEEDRGRRAERGLRLSLRLGDEDAQRFGIAESLEELRARVTQHAVGTEECPDEVLRAQVFRRCEPREELIALLGSVEFLVGQTLDDVSRAGLEKDHDRAV